MSQMTYEQRQTMVGRKFMRDINRQNDFSVEVLKVEAANNGFSVCYMAYVIIGGVLAPRISYASLREFHLRYPHMIED